MEKYATRMLVLTADTQVDKNHDKLDKNTRKNWSPLGIRSDGCTDKDRDYCLLAQDCIYHDCNDYCLGEVKNQDRMDRIFVGRVVSDSEPKNMQEKGTPKARTFTKKQKL